MSVALVGIGAVVGFFGGLFALVSGAGILAALGIYAGIGITALLMAAAVIALRPETDPEPAKILAIPAE